MATYLELAKNDGVKIGDSISFPTREKPGERHTSVIVGPRTFPKSEEVFLAPPIPGEGTALYNPATGQLDRRGVYDRNTGVWTLGPAAEGEIVVQTIHGGYVLFERA
ncbi:hypothetical protein A3D03_03780 [Candidatus Gottesmanbacteria bacterium RIFCSPHIGHO2_02_FULL_40_13]|uniref:Uncharacterized protein n=1 Tax=Candidatus Gottesmanbacteria bacterium RIFCSPHIGHO2_02_FULL_40_13 TaxID=1798384 RepID=A0A1F6ACL9_9BACT|nr:MAG: hypothetical protein A3D03_03780 [Candidatus Gottesmanbacteria bacterium RIFCSPHIGHO2_02_FULL_40_13]